MRMSQITEQGRFLGEEFLTWLWWRGLVHGGTSGREDDQSACYLDNGVQLASERGDVKTITLKDGNPTESQEAFEALSRGMRPVKAKIRILAGDLEWVFTLQAATLSPSGMKLPATASKDPMSRLADRLFLLEEGYAHLDRRYRQFLEARQEDPETMLADLRTWIRSGLNHGAGADAEEAPWEQR